MSGALFLASAFGPGLAAIITTLRFDGAAGLRRWLIRCLNWRLGWRWAGVVVGVAWALWHAPLLLMADTVQAGLPIAWFVASTIGLSVVMARLSVNTSFSVLPAILLHSVINWWSMILPIMPEGGDTQAYSLVAGITILVALVALRKPGPMVGDNPSKIPANGSRP